MSAFVGIDIAKNSFDIATPLHNGKFRTKAKLPNDLKGYQVLQTWLETHSEPGAWVVMEATSVYHLGVADFLYALGYRVCVSSTRPLFTSTARTTCAGSRQTRLTRS
jgi:transposase